MRRREYLGVVGAGTLALGAEAYTSRDVKELDNPLGLSQERLKEDDYWTLSVLPDTQNYASDEEYLEHARRQAEWIRDNVEEFNIVFVTHEGDLVNDGSSEKQWDRIETALEPLDDEVPYSVVPGNHDWNSTYDKSSGIENYMERFGEERFQDADWYMGSGPYGLSHAQTFSGGDQEFLHLGLEWEPRDETLEWAQQKIEEYRQPTILTTHSHLHKGVLDKGRMDEVMEKQGLGSHADTVFDDLIRPNTEVFMVLSGHSFGGLLPRNRGEYRQLSSNEEGEPVFEMLADYQDRRNGGNGWMRNVTFLPGDEKSKVKVSTHSPSTGSNQVGAPSDFSFRLNLEER